MNEMMQSPPPLLLDAMLGRLARWLRLMGYDAAYLPDTDDIEVVRQARAEARVILTRDRGLARRSGIRAILIDSQCLEEQITEVRQHLGLPSEPITARCGVCNTPLCDLAHHAAQGRVPPYIWRTQAAFTECTHCRRVYWHGTHWDAIQHRLKSAL
jgi:uncharacterized protein with PIN domain